MLARARLDHGRRHDDHQLAVRCQCAVARARQQPSAAPCDRDLSAEALLWKTLSGEALFGGCDQASDDTQSVRRQRQRQAASRPRAGAVRAEKKISRWRRVVHTPAASLRPNGRPRGMLGHFAAPASRRQVNECAGLTRPRQPRRQPSPWPGLIHHVSMVRQQPLEPVRSPAEPKEM